MVWRLRFPISVLQRSVSQTGAVVSDVRVGIGASIGSAVVGAGIASLIGLTWEAAVVATALVWLAIYLLLFVVNLLMNIVRPERSAEWHAQMDPKRPGEPPTFSIHRRASPQFGNGLACVVRDPNGVRSRAERPGGIEMHCHYIYPSQFAGAPSAVALGEYLVIWQSRDARGHWREILRTLHRLEEKGEGS